MPNVTFRGAEIRYLDLRKDEAGVFARMHMTADFSKPVQEAMGWKDVPESIPSGKLSGALAATHMILTPNDKSLTKYEMQFDVSEVKDFSFTSETDDDGRITGRKIRFVVVSPSVGIEAHVGNWLRAVGGVSAACKVGYAKQETLYREEECTEITKTVIEIDKPASDNDLNRLGSGRERKRQMRGGGEASQADAAELAERAAVAAKIEEQLQ